jgi:hypothetical protein
MRPGITRPFNVEGHLFPQGLRMLRLTVLLREKQRREMRLILQRRTSIREQLADNLKEGSLSLSSEQDSR